MVGGAPGFALYLLGDLEQSAWQVWAWASSPVNREQCQLPFMCSPRTTGTSCGPKMVLVPLELTSSGKTDNRQLVNWHVNFRS